MRSVLSKLQRGTACCTDGWYTCSREKGVAGGGGGRGGGSDVPTSASVTAWALNVVRSFLPLFVLGGGRACVHTQGWRSEGPTTTTITQLIWLRAVRPKNAAEE